jgi:tryptophan 2,3-dioxygenase
LRQAGYEPIHEVHQFETDLRLQEQLVLLAASEMAVPGEMLVQIQHQAQELWLKYLALEAATLVEALDGDALSEAMETLDRIIAGARCLSEQTRTLFALTSSHRRSILGNLGSATGIASPGYQRVLTAVGNAWGALERMRIRRGDAHRAELQGLLERFGDWDGAMQAWMAEQILLRHDVSFPTG